MEILIQNELLQEMLGVKFELPRAVQVHHRNAALTADCCHCVLSCPYTLYEGGNWQGVRNLSETSTSTLLIYLSCLEEVRVRVRR